MFDAPPRNLRSGRLFACTAARIQHILNKDTVDRGGVVDHHVRDRSHRLAVLNDGGARHECGQAGTTAFNKKLKSQKRK